MSISKWDRSPALSISLVSVLLHASSRSMGITIGPYPLQDENWRTAGGIFFRSRQKLKCSCLAGQKADGLCSIVCCWSKRGPSPRTPLMAIRGSTLKYRYSTYNNVVCGHIGIAPQLRCDRRDRTITMKRAFSAQLSETLILSLIFIPFYPPSPWADLGGDYQDGSESKDAVECCSGAGRLFT